MILASILPAFISCKQNDSFKVNQTYSGFKLTEKRFVKEVNAECLYFVHEKSGARLFKIAADDPNKLFNIAFKTAPENDYGTPHIMEHSVLNGSKHFPVKSPFDVLIQGSLNTFLNAMTGADITTYPVASMNDKDYFNLMHVYLDAVFYPMIYSDPRILKQEGWHHELTDKKADVVYKGVVYNEMKGAYSSPEAELEYQKGKNLFPDNTYGVESGGYPTEIPKLTYDYFINFHKKFYHPSNSYITLYGNANLKQELAFIDSLYLSDFARSEMKVEIPLQKPFSEMKVVDREYPLPEGSSADGQTFLNLSWVVGKSTDQALTMALDVLSEALVNHESGPVKRALLDAGIGRDISAGVSVAQQNVFSITVKNANPGDRDKFREIVYNTMKKVAEEGLDKKMIEGILNRIEFNLREGNTPQKGLMYAMQNYQGWFFGNDPFVGLCFEEPLAKVKSSLQGSLLEETIKNDLLSNNHALLLMLKPKPGLQSEINASTAKELAQFKSTLDEKGIADLVKETNDLVGYQQRQDSPEALATIPLLQLSDIGKEPEWFGVNEKSIDNVPLLFHKEFTNDILYTNLYFDLRALPQELIPYASLLTSVLSKMGTANYTFGDLDNALNIHTGGFNSSTRAFLLNKDDNNLFPVLAVTSKATIGKAVNLAELTGEIINRTKFDDLARLKELVTRHYSQVDANVKNNGMKYALSRLRSYYSNQGMFDELSGGIEYYNFLSGLVADFDKNGNGIADKLKETASVLFGKNNLTIAVTCSEENLPVFEQNFKNLVVSLPQGKPEKTAWKFEFAKKNEGLLSASKVQYVVQGYDYKKLGYSWSGKMKVLNQVLSTDWLQNQVRVIGGAYGGFCGFSPTGNVYFASYRDPNLKETLDTYAKTNGFLQNFSADEKGMTRFIIGTVSEMDSPMTPSQKGGLAVQYYFDKTSYDDLLKERQEVLTTSKEDIKNMQKMVEDIIAQKAFCVYGNEEKIRENKALFGSVVSIIK